MNLALSIALTLAALGIVRGDEGNAGHNLRGAGDAESKSAFQPVHPDPRPGCRGWVECVDGYWGNFRCTDGRYCRGGWEGDDNKAAEVEENTKEQKAAFEPVHPDPRPGCRGWVECVDGYWGNFRCTDGRYCRGGWEGDDNKAAEVEENTKEQKAAFEPVHPDPRPGCRGWVECVDGYWGNFRCTDGRYCRGGWEGDDNKAAEVEENTKEQKAAFEPVHPDPRPGCRGWVECVDGYWGNFRCTDGRYCRGGWEGDDNKAAEVEENTKEQKAAFEPVHPDPRPGCRGWVECVDGYWGNFRCTDGRYCRGGWEGDDNKAAEVEENTKEQKAAFEPVHPDPRPGCRGWVECVDGYWGNFRCTDGRYCRGGWEGDDNKAAEVEENTKEQKAAFEPVHPDPRPGCRGWVECVDGYWGNFRCTDGRYCRGGWEGDDNKAAEVEENTKEQKAAFEPVHPDPRPGCRGWVECVDGYWGNFRCTYGRYCRGGWEGDDNKAAEVEENLKGKSTQGEDSVFIP